MGKSLKDIRISFENAFLSVIVLYYCVELMLITSFENVRDSVVYGSLYSGVMLVVVAFAILAAARDYRNKTKDLSTDQDTQRRALIMLGLRLAIVVLAVLSFSLYRQAVHTWMLLVVAVSCVELREDKIIKYCMCCGFVVVAAAFVLSMLDIIDNNRGNSFGFVYRTHYACMLLCLALAYCLYKDGKLTWKGELGLVLLFLYNLIFVGGKTCAVCLFLLIVGTLLRHYRRAKGIPFQDKERYGSVVRLVFKALYFPIKLLDACITKCPVKMSRKTATGLMKYSFVICAVIFIALTLGYGKLRDVYELVPGLGSIKARFLLGHLAFTHQPITLMGTLVPQHGNSIDNGVIDMYYALDSGYVKVLIEYGIIAFAAMLGLFTFAQKRLLDKRRYYSMFILSIFALDGMIEYWMIYLCYNLFILLASCKLQTVPAEYPEAEVITEAERKKRPAKAALGALGVAVFALWCYTAYPISTWSGWTPEENATVVIPGSYMDGAGSKKLMEERMKTAASYLTYYPESECIIASSDADQIAEVLMYWGIDKSRIRVDKKANSAEEMLSNSYRTIKKNGMPSRLTVCTYQMQQERVKRAAAKQHIPVNSICPEMPWHLYLPNYLVEQGRILI